MAFDGQDGSDTMDKQMHVPFFKTTIENQSPNREINVENEVT